MAKITDKQINAKPSAKDKWLNEVTIWGHGSLIARITPTGERLFYFRYINSLGKRTTLPIGTYSRTEKKGMMTLAQAGLRSMELAALHKSGTQHIREYLELEQAINTAEREAALSRLETEKDMLELEQAQLDARKTVQDLFEHWTRIDLINRKDSGAEIKRMFAKDVLPLIGKLPVEEIKKGHVIEVVDKLLARRVNRMAKLIFSLMRQMFRFAVDRDLMEQDPTASIRKAKIGGKEVERDRVLSEDEVQTLAQSIDEAGLMESTKVSIWLVLSTCCRIGELLNAKWEHIDFENQTWTIPAEYSKNAKQHTIYLSDFATQYYKQLYSINNHSDWCYPNRSNTTAVCTKTITKQLTDRQRPLDQAPFSNRSGNAHSLILPHGRWTPHDLRRTGATLMTALGTLPEVAERCLNHIEENKIKRIYQRYSYQSEMKEAWQQLGKHLQELISLPQ